MSRYHVVLPHKIAKLEKMNITTLKNKQLIKNKKKIETCNSPKDYNSYYMLFILHVKKVVSK